MIWGMGLWSLICWANCAEAGTLSTVSGGESDQPRRKPKPARPERQETVALPGQRRFIGLLSPDAPDFGDHSLIDARINTLVRGGDEHSDLDDVERYLDGRAS